MASRWTLRASLTEARRGVTCLEFAPRHWGLKLAVGSADGCVRIYEAVDIMNLSQWPLAAALQSFEEGSKLGCTCLSWCNGRFEPPTLVAGGSHLVIYRYSESARAWQPLVQLPAPAKGDVLDVAWAPNVGRRFHYIASAENQQLRIYKFRRDAADNKSNDTSSNNKHLKLESSQTIDANAWRCQWNVTGTVLASSGDGGTVQLWKSDLDGNFVCVSKVQGDLSQVTAKIPA
jgi:nucleoporin SEH1